MIAQDYSFFILIQNWNNYFLGLNILLDQEKIIHIIETISKLRVIQLWNYISNRFGDCVVIPFKTTYFNELALLLAGTRFPYIKSIDRS